MLDLVKILKLQNTAYFIIVYVNLNTLFYFDV